MDCTNRLVAAELERRWNHALSAQQHLEEELESLRRDQPGPLSSDTKEELLAVAEDLPQLWDHPASSPEYKKRILRTVLKEIVAWRDEDTIRLVLHWQGGDHTELQFQKIRTGQHRYTTDGNTVELIRALAAIQPDPMIASILNRLGRRTAHNQTWNARRVCSLRNNHAIPVYRDGERQGRGELTVSEVAAILGVSSTTVLRMIRHQLLPATQVCANAPWILLKEDIDTFLAASQDSECPQSRNSNQLTLKIQ